jgi:KDO2-lipid IV(A) lauroyltransferase
VAKKELPAWQSLPLRGLLASLGFSVSLLPRRAEVSLGRLFGRLVYRGRLFKRRVVEENVARCFPELDGRTRQDLIRRNYEHYGLMFLEYLHFFSPVKGHWRRYVPTVARYEGLEHWREAAARGKGVVFFSAHMGAWEMGGAVVALQGVPATIVTTVLTPRWLHEKLTACRASTGIDAAFHPGSLPKVLKTLRRGGTVAFMNDQYAGPPMGTPVVFFGARVDTLAVVGSLSRRTGAVVLPMSTFRDPDGTMVARVEPEFDLGGNLEDPADATQRVAAHVEGWIRARPEQWLWMHRRFKNVHPPVAA